MLNWLISHSPLWYFVQSIWRDEAFSILAAERPLASILGKLTFEPPVYYILLHFWIKLFGESEIAARSLSLVGFTLATAVVVVWAEKLFKKHWLSWFLPLFFFLNPMLIYYAFEVRTYGWYIFWAVLSMYAYLSNRWILYAAAGILGFYTHTYFGVVLFVEALHWALINRQKFFKIRKFVNEPMVLSTAAIAIAIAPWLMRIVATTAKLKDSWYFPVNFNLIRSVLGNMFLGYEGTPWYLWGATAWLSLLLLGFFIWALIPAKTRKRNLFFLLMAVVPLVIVIGISFVKPLFVNRYLIPVTVAEVILLGLAIAAIPNHVFQKFIAAIFFLSVIFFNGWYPWQHRKLDIRTPIKEINALREKDDIVLVESPLVFFETIYYASNRNQVYLFNPNHSAFPWYVGEAIFSPSQMMDKLPVYPIRAFMIRADGTYTVAYLLPGDRRAAKPYFRRSL